MKNKEDETMTTYEGEPLNILHTIGLDILYPVVRGEISFDKRLDRSRFENALKSVTRVVPEIMCRYEMSNNSFEQITDNVSDLIKNNVKQPDLDAKKWDLMKDPQVRIYWEDNEEKTRLIIYISHILTDGAGSKQLLYLIANAYSNGDAALDGVKNHQEIDWLEKLVSQHQMTPSKQTDHPSEPLLLPHLDTDGSRDYHVGSVELSKDETNRLIEATHLTNTTVNDVVMTAFSRVIQRFAGINSISMACPTDMRKFGPTVDGVQVANFTSRYNLSIDTPLSEPFGELVARVHTEMNEHKKQYQCFDSIKGLLENYQTQPLAELQQVVQDNYHVREIAYTNFGIIDQNKLVFDGVKITQVVMTGGFRTAPMYQIATATYDDQLSLAFNMVGTNGEMIFGMAIARNVADLINNFALSALEK